MARKEIKLDTKFGDTVHGYAWNVDKPKANLVIVTGMEEYALRYDEFATYLNEHGYDVFCFDHYGQGLNAKSKEERGVVPPSFFSKSVDNIEQIVTSVKESKLPTTVLAHSMGSFMLQNYIQKYNKTVNKIVLVGTNGPNAKMSYKFGKAIAKLTLTKKNRNQKHFFMDKMIFGLYGKHFKDEGASSWLSLSKANVDKYKLDEQCGYVSSHGFYYEFMKGCNGIYKKKGLNNIRKDMSILIVSGSDDPVGAYGKGPYKLFKLYKKLGIENVELKLYDELRHELLNEENRKEAYEDILAFLDK